MNIKRSMWKKSILHIIEFHVKSLLYLFSSEIERRKDKKENANTNEATTIFDEKLQNTLEWQT